MSSLLNIEIARTLVNERMRAAETARLRNAARGMPVSQLHALLHRHTS